MTRHNYASEGYTLFFPNSNYKKILKNSIGNKRLTININVLNIKHNRTRDLNKNEVIDDLPMKNPE
jgi:hypothetical protein